VGISNFYKKKPPPPKVSCSVATYYTKPVAKHTFVNGVSPLYHPCTISVETMSTDEKAPIEQAAWGRRGSAPPPPKDIKLRSSKC